MEGFDGLPAGLIPFVHARMEDITNVSLTDKDGTYFGQYAADRTVILTFSDRLGVVRLSIRIPSITSSLDWPRYINRLRFSHRIPDKNA